MFLGSAAYAQNPPLPPQTQDQHETGGTTITGCLTKGANPGEYVITDSKSGEKTTFAGPDRLESYLNHTVQLTGKMMSTNDGKTFQPQSIKTVSNTCGSER
jgi:hypothetical protein